MILPDPPTDPAIIAYAEFRADFNTKAGFIRVYTHLLARLRFKNGNYKGIILDAYELTESHRHQHGLPRAYRDVESFYATLKYERRKARLARNRTRATVSNPE